ncbi:MAG: DUF2723 domain-containing protein [Candidatus Coatesbacteria bacterium]|nr:DUF2723 domain-containing protein [Candidatus Coatesbacteria bacterium]
MIQKEPDGGAASPVGLSTGLSAELESNDGVVRSPSWTPLLYLLAALAVFVVYALTSAPGTVILESNYDLTVAARHLGCAHSPGYPLHSLFAHPLCAVGPWGAVFAVNLLSGLWGALAVFLLALFLEKLGCRPLAALSGALLFAFSATFWSQAGLTEVYTQHLALTIVALYAALAASRSALADEPDRRPTLALGLLTGLLVVSHNAALTYLPALALLALPALKRLDARGWALFIVAGALGFSVYLYLPLRAATDPPINWSAPNTWHGFWSGLSHDVYVDHGVGRSLSLLGDQAAWIAQTWWGDLAPGVSLLGLAGLFYAARGRRRLLWTLLLLLLLPALGLLLAHNQDLVELRGSDETFLITGALVLCIGLALGLEKLGEALSERRILSRLIPLLGLAAAAGTAAFSLPRADLSQRRTAEEIGADVVGQSPYRAVLAVSLVSSDAIYFDNLVRLEVRDQRPDLALSSAYQPSEPWYQRELAARGRLLVPDAELVRELWRQTIGAPGPFIAQGFFAREYNQALAELNQRPLAVAVVRDYFEHYFLAGATGRDGFRPVDLLEIYPPPGGAAPIDSHTTPPVALRRYRPAGGTHKYDRAADEFYHWRDELGGE